MSLHPLIIRPLAPIKEPITSGNAGGAMQRRSHGPLLPHGRPRTSPRDHSGRTQLPRPPRRPRSCRSRRHGRPRPHIPRLQLSDPTALRGWAVPVAADITFALAVASVLGPRIPITLKIFLTTLAIIDDLGAIIVIALFYTNNLDLIALALVLVGKQLGVFGAAMLAIRLRLARMPQGVTIPQLYSASILCGIGFTMSLFLGDLAFRESPRGDEVKLAVFIASLAAALLGLVVLALCRPKRN